MFSNGTLSLLKLKKVTKVEVTILLDHLKNLNQMRLHFPMKQKELHQLTLVNEI